MDLRPDHTHRNWREKFAAQVAAPFIVPCEDSPDGYAWDPMSGALLAKILLSGHKGLKEDAKRAKQPPVNKARTYFYGWRQVKLGRLNWYIDGMQKERPIITSDVLYRFLGAKLQVKEFAEPSFTHGRKGIDKWRGKTYESMHVTHQTMNKNTTEATRDAFDIKFASQLPDDTGRDLGLPVESSTTPSGTVSHIISSLIYEVEPDRIVGREYGDVDGKRTQQLHRHSIWSFTDGMHALMRARVDLRFLDHCRRHGWDPEKGTTPYAHHNPPVWDDVKQGKADFDIDLAISYLPRYSQLFGQHMKEMLQDAEFARANPGAAGSAISTIPDEAAGPAAGAQSLLKNLNDPSWTSLKPGEVIEMALLKPAGVANTTSSTVAPAGVKFRWVGARQSGILVPQTASQQNILGKRKRSADDSDDDGRTTEIIAPHDEQLAQDPPTLMRKKIDDEKSAATAELVVIKQVVTDENAETPKSEDGEEKTHRADPSTAAAIRGSLGAIGLGDSDGKKTSRKSKLGMFE